MMKKRNTEWLLPVLALMLLILGACAAPQPASSPATETTPPQENSAEPTEPPSQAATEASPEPTFTVPAPTMTPSVQVNQDIVYATSMHEDGVSWMLDVYTPDGTGNKPVVVFLHGFKALKEGHVRESRALVEAGFVVFTVTWPTWINDLAAQENGKGFREMTEVVGCALRYARAAAPGYGGDPTRVVLVGFSMGAAYNAPVALAEGRMDGVWNDFAAAQEGPPPQVACVENEGPARADAFVGIGGNYQIFDSLQKRVPALWEILNPLAQITPGSNFRVRLLHGEQDEFVPSENSIWLNDALIEAGLFARPIAVG